MEKQGVVTNFYCRYCSSAFSKIDKLYDHQLTKHRFCMLCNVCLRDKNVESHDEIHKPHFVVLHKLSEYEILNYLPSQIVVKVEPEDIDIIEQESLDLDHLSNHHNLIENSLENSTKAKDLSYFLLNKLKNCISTLNDEPEMSQLDPSSEISQLNHSSEVPHPESSEPISGTLGMSEMSKMENSARKLRSTKPKASSELPQSDQAEHNSELLSTSESSELSRYQRQKKSIKDIERSRLIQLNKEFHEKVNTANKAKKAKLKATSAVGKSGLLEHNGAALSLEESSKTGIYQELAKTKRRREIERKRWLQLNLKLCKNINVANKSKRAKPKASSELPQSDQVEHINEMLSTSESSELSRYQRQTKSKKDIERIRLIRLNKEFCEKVNTAKRGNRSKLKATSKVAQSKSEEQISAILSSEESSPILSSEESSATLSSEESSETGSYQEPTKTKRQRDKERRRLLRLNPEYRARENAARRLRANKAVFEVQELEPAEDNDGTPGSSEVKKRSKQEQTDREKHNERRRLLRLDPEYRARENAARKLRAANKAGSKVPQTEPAENTPEWDKAEQSREKAKKKRLRDIERRRLLRLIPGYRERENAARKLRANKVVSEVPQLEPAEHNDGTPGSSELNKLKQQEKTERERHNERRRLLRLNPEYRARENAARKMRMNKVVSEVPQLEPAENNDGTPGSSELNKHSQQGQTERERRNERRRLLRLNPAYRARENAARKLRANKVVSEVPQLEPAEHNDGTQGLLELNKLKQGQTERERHNERRRLLRLNPEYRARENAARKLRANKVVSQVPQLVTAEYNNGTPGSSELNKHRQQGQTERERHNEQKRLLRSNPHYRDLERAAYQKRIAKTKLMRRDPDVVNPVNSDLEKSITEEVLMYLKKTSSTIIDTGLNKVYSDFVCDECNVPFNDYSTLRKHIMSHSEGSPFQCNNCKIVFTWKQSLNIHKCKVATFS